MGGRSEKEGNNTVAIEQPIPERSTWERVRDVVSRRSVVPAGPHSNREGYSGPPKEYDPFVIQMGYRLNKDPEAFKEIKKRFDTHIDRKTGKTMTQICREYWESKKGKS